MRKYIRLMRLQDQYSTIGGALAAGVSVSNVCILDEAGDATFTSVCIANLVFLGKTKRIMDLDIL